VRPALDAAEAETAGGGRTGRRRRNVHRRLQGRCSVGSPISYMPHTGGAASGRVGRGRVADEDLRRGRAPAAHEDKLRRRTSGGRRRTSGRSFKSGTRMKPSSEGRGGADDAGSGLSCGRGGRTGEIRPPAAAAHPAWPRSREPPAYLTLYHI
jgi:hypothetical protein